MAKKNIKIGPTIQFKTNEVVIILVSLNTCPRFSYFTFAKGGYIIKINPIAKGIFVVPLEKELIKVADNGKKKPTLTPIAMAKKIQSVKKRSKKPSFLRSAIGAQLFADILLS